MARVQTDSTSQAKNNPVIASGMSEIDSAGLELPQRPDIVMPASGIPDHDNIVAAEGVSEHSDYMKELAFAETPITIMVQASNSDNPEPWVQCSVNGVGCEIMQNGKWVRYGHFPVEQWVTTKVKYAEVLLRQRADTIRTDIHKLEGQDPQNRLIRRSSAKTPINIQTDGSVKIAKWIERIQREYS